MVPRWWYLRRGVAWQPVLGCCAAAAAAGAVLGTWPATAMVVLPALLGCCAAGAAFAFDEPSVAVTAVTPRGATWRRTTRLAVAGVPLAVWAGVVWSRPGELPLVRSGWWLAGAAAVGLAAGVAALLSRRDVALPGAGLAAVVVLTAVAPVVAAGFLGVQTPYPVAGFSGGVHAFWAGVAVAGAVVCAAALRPGLRR